MSPSSKIRSLCPVIALPRLEAELFNVAATLIGPRSPFAKSSGILSARSCWCEDKGRGGMDPLFSVCRQNGTNGDGLNVVNEDIDSG